MLLHSDRAQLRKLVAMTLVAGLALPVSVPAAEGKSRRVLRDTSSATKSGGIRRDSLSLQTSKEAGSKTSSTADTSVSSSTSSLPTTTGMKGVTLLGYTPAVTAATGVTGSIVPPDNSAEAAGMAAAIMGMGAALMGGDKKPSSSNTTGNRTVSNTGNSNSANTPSADNSTNPGIDTTTTGAIPKGNVLNDSSSANTVDPELAASKTKINDRDCSATSKIWQPPFSERFVVTSCFGSRTRSGRTRPHNGVDMVGEGKPAYVKPVSAGRIVRADGSDSGGYGCQIIIEHDNCPQNAKGEGKCYSHYAHLAARNGKCPGTVGAVVGPCDNIGVMGDTGGSNGDHLHFELRTSASADSKLNPITQFAEWRAHKNYDASGSRCSGNKDISAPSKARTTEEHVHAID